MEDSSHIWAIEALRTFAASPEQIVHLCRIPPSIQGEFFFPGVPIARYLAGVGCVYTTYKNSLIDVAPDSASSAISEVNEILEGMHQIYTKKRWSLDAVNSSPFWQELRQQSKLTLHEIGENPPNPPRPINVGLLINLDEFYPPRSVKKLLRQLGLN